MMAVSPVLRPAMSYRSLTTKVNLERGPDSAPRRGAASPWGTSASAVSTGSCTCGKFRAPRSCSRSTRRWKSGVNRDMLGSLSMHTGLSAGLKGKERKGKLSNRQERQTTREKTEKQKMRAMIAAVAAVLIAIVLSPVHGLDDGQHLLFCRCFSCRPLCVYRAVQDANHGHEQLDGIRFYCDGAGSAQCGKVLRDQRSTRCWVSTEPLEDLSSCVLILLRHYSFTELD